MLRLLFAVVCTLFTASLVAQEPLKVLPAQPKPGDAASYQIGFDMGMQLRAAGLLDSDIADKDFLAGFIEALKGSERRLTQPEIQAAMQGLSSKVQARMEEKAKQSLAASNTFLEENKKKQGVTALPSGLQYEVIKSGGGAMPNVKSTVVVHYEGKLISGKVFDSSVARNMPFTTGLNNIIPGWIEALSRMKVGDKWRLFIPPALAYREEGRPPVIGPNETLIFELELLEVQ